MSNEYSFTIRFVPIQAFGSNFRHFLGQKPDDLVVFETMPSFPGRIKLKYRVIRRRFEHLACGDDQVCVGNLVILPLEAGRAF